MKLNKLFIAIPFLLLFSACDRREMPYVFQTCDVFFTKTHEVSGPIKPTDKHWKIVEQSLDKDYVLFQYEGDPFTDACVSEANGMQANITGNYMELTAYVKVFDTDSFAIPLTKVFNGTNNTWTGNNSAIDLKNYSLHYPGRMFPVVYAKIYYDYPVTDIGASFVELNKAFGSFTFKPTGKKF